MRERNSGIDLLKFVAAIFIVLGHLNERFIIGLPNAGLFGLTDVVELFFLTSGYLCRDLSKLNSPNGIIKKVLRVYPMIFITTTVAIILNEIAHVVYGGPSTGVICAVTSYLLVFKLAIIPDQIGIDPNLWYMGILIFCFCVAYVIKKIEEKLNIHYIFSSIVLVLLGAACVNSGTNSPFWNYYTGRGVAAFFLGVILWDVINNRINIKNWWIFTCVELVIVVAVFKWMLDLNFERIESIWEVELFVLFPACLHIAISLGNYIKSSVFAILGDASFEMYIWQGIGFTVLKSINVSRGTEEVSFIGVVGFLAILLAWSCIVNKFVEKPLNEKFIQKVAK